MKFNSTFAALTISAGISLTAVCGSAEVSGLSETRLSSIRTALSSAKLVEAPYRAAHLIMAAKKDERPAVTRASVETVLEKYPTALSATVRAVLTVAPEQAQVVLDAVMAKAPKAISVALNIVSELNPSILQVASKSTTGSDSTQSFGPTKLPKTLNGDSTYTVSAPGGFTYLIGNTTYYTTDPAFAIQENNINGR